LGLRCVLLLRGEAPNTPASNNLLARLFGAEIFYLNSEQYYEGMGDFRQVLDEQIRAQGGKTYFIPEGGSNALGAFGYAAAFVELEGQRARGEIPGYDASLPFDSMVIAHGSGGTQAGLILGKLGAGEEAENTRIVGINVCYDAPRSRSLVKDALWQCIQQYRLPLSFAAIDLEVKDGALGRGYGLSTPEELKFIAKVARSEGMLVDPVYTGKALFNLYRAVKEDRNAFGNRVLFWHTGGGFGLFKLGDEWAEAL
ncbi:MAG: pyridoxal-phosphate dependent enzyme, partial [Proteobacteria bacterium]